MVYSIHTHTEYTPTLCCQEHTLFFQEDTQTVLPRAPRTKVTMAPSITEYMEDTKFENHRLLASPFGDSFQSEAPYLSRTGLSSRPGEKVLVPEVPALQGQCR
jgi:hypothetical protein